MEEKFCPFQAPEDNDLLMNCNENCALYVNGKCVFVVTADQQLEIKDQLEEIKNILKSINHG